MRFDVTLLFHTAQVSPLLLSLSRFWFNNKSQTTAVAKSRHQHQLRNISFSYLLFYLSTLLAKNPYFGGLYPPTEDPIRAGSALRPVESPS